MCNVRPSSKHYSNITLGITIILKNSIGNLCDTVISKLRPVIVFKIPKPNKTSFYIQKY